MNNHYKKLREQKMQALDTRAQSAEPGNQKESTRCGGNSNGVPVSAQFESGESNFLRVENHRLASAVGGEAVKPNDVAEAAITGAMGHPSTKLKKDSRSAQQVTTTGEIIKSATMLRESESEHDGHVPERPLSKASSILNSNHSSPGNDSQR